jgi:hypothetical protein
LASRNDAPIGTAGEGADQRLEVRCVNGAIKTILHGAALTHALARQRRRVDDVMALFSPEELRQAVAAAIPADLPVGHRNAVVSTVDQAGMKVEARLALDEKNHWQVIAAYAHAWDGTDRAGAQLVVSW